MKFVFGLLLIPAFTMGAVWPENFGAYQRTSSERASVSDKPVWDEYGLKAAETARYESGGRTFTATAYRLQDPTGALGAFQWQRPKGATASKLAKLAVETSKGVMLVHGNYLFWFDNYKPTVQDMAGLIPNLRDVDNTPLPTLPDYLPTQDLVAGSDRFIQGPAALEKFDPAVPPSVEAFSMGAEAQTGDFKTSSGTMRLAIFNYPTHQIAMQRAPEFQNIAGARVKRSGPLVAVIVSPSDADAAERLLSHVRYEASVTMSEYVPSRRDNIGNLVINAFVLIGILLAFAAVAGVAYGGLRTVLRRGRTTAEADSIIVLNLR